MYFIVLQSEEDYIFSVVEHSFLVVVNALHIQGRLWICEFQMDRWPVTGSEVREKTGDADSPTNTMR